MLQRKRHRDTKRKERQQGKKGGNNVKDTNSKKPSQERTIKTQEESHEVE